MDCELQLLPLKPDLRPFFPLLETWLRFSFLPFFFFNYIVRIYSSAQEGKSQSCCTSCLGTIASQLLSSDAMVQFVGDALTGICYLGSACGILFILWAKTHLGACGRVPELPRGLLVLTAACSPKAGWNWSCSWDHGKTWESLWELCSGYVLGGESSDSFSKVHVGILVTGGDKMQILSCLICS